MKTNTVRHLIFLVLSIFIQGCLKGEYAVNSNQGVVPGAATFLGAKSAENLSGTAIQVNWDLSTDSSVSEYDIYLVNADASLSLIGVAGATSNLFVHSGLTPGKIQTYVVRSVNSAGSADANIEKVSAISYAGLSSAVVIDATTADLNFPTASDATGLKIYCAAGASGAMTVMATVSALTTTYRLTGLTTSTIYSCKVKALLPDGSEDTNPLLSSFTPQTVSPSSPFGFNGIGAASNVDATSVLVQWTAATPATGTTIASYRIYQINADDSLTVYNAAANATSYTVSGLNSGQNYNFIVRALDSNSLTDGNQTMKSAFTYAGISSGSATSSTSATIYFPAAPNASNLHVYCYPSSGAMPATPTASIASTLNVYVVNSLVTATNYNCLVKAVGASGEDGNTATVSFTTP